MNKLRIVKKEGVAEFLGGIRYLRNFIPILQFQMSYYYRTQRTSLISRYMTAERKLRIEGKDQLHKGCKTWVLFIRIMPTCCWHSLSIYSHFSNGHVVGSQENGIQQALHLCLPNNASRWTFMNKHCISYQWGNKGWSYKEKIFCRRLRGKWRKMKVRANRYIQKNIPNCGDTPQFICGNKWASNFFFQGLSRLLITLLLN